MIMETYSGRLLNLADPQPEDILIKDIAHALGMNCRFNGHVKFFYSVAQHSVILSQLVEPELEYLALMHDAAEAYISDLIRPIKAQMPEYKALEKRLEAAIFTRFNVPWTEKKWAAVMEADNRLLVTEKARVVQTDNPWPRVDIFKPFNIEIIKGWTPEDAASFFESRWASFQDSLR